MTLTGYSVVELLNNVLDVMVASTPFVLEVSIIGAIIATAVLNIINFLVQRRKKTRLQNQGIIVDPTKPQINVLKELGIRFWTPAVIIVMLFGLAIFVGNLYYYTAIVPARTDPQIEISIALFILGMSIVAIAPVARFVKIMFMAESRRQKEINT
jgi:hypothetical protein